jgi:hypothetical protein
MLTQRFRRSRAIWLGNASLNLKTDKNMNGPLTIPCTLTKRAGNWNYVLEKCLE